MFSVFLIYIASIISLPALSDSFTYWRPAPDVSPDEGFRHEAETSINGMFWLYESNLNIVELFCVLLFLSVHITFLPIILCDVCIIYFWVCDDFEFLMQLIRFSSVYDQLQLKSSL